MNNILYPVHLIRDMMKYATIALTYTKKDKLFKKNA